MDEMKVNGSAPKAIVIGDTTKVLNLVLKLHNPY
jgi:hypothetical protein